MYGGCVRFYNTVLKMKLLDHMKEDLIEVLTKLVINAKMSSFLLALCNVLTRLDDQELERKFNELFDMKPG